MKRLSSWILSLVCGGLVACGTTGLSVAAEPGAKASGASRSAPVWQMVIAPRHGAPVVADFHAESDGSLSVVHRPIAPGETIGGPDARTPEETAPPPAPAAPVPEGPALPPSAGMQIRPARMGTPTAGRKLANPFRLTAQQSETKEDKGPVLPAPVEPTPSPTTKVRSETKSASPAGVVPPTAPTTEPSQVRDQDAKTPATEGEPAAEAAVDGPGHFGHGPSYAEIYFSIPFLRTEYEANPAYRHEATMEILFGQLRPTVIHKEAPRPVVRAREYDYITPYRYWNGRGYVNYNFFYPRPSVYRQY